MNIISKIGRTPLDMAILKFNQDLIDLFLAQDKLDINYRGLCGNTSLMTAVECGNIEAIKNSLLEREDLDVNIQNKNLSTPLMLAIQNNYKDIVKKLLNHPKININLKDSDGETALSVSLKHGFFYLSRLLIQ
ncbi:ankyrin, partial [Anaeromyces robustus]